MLWTLRSYNEDVSWKLMSLQLSPLYRQWTSAMDVKPNSANIYIPAKSELMTTIQSIMQSQFFLDYNFNYTNMGNFLIWHKTNFATLTPEEIKTLKAKMLKLPTMPMEYI